MKNTKFLTTAFTLILFFFTATAFGQTTQEEYNYVTKGYKIQIESGLDMKKGYTLVDLGKWGLQHGEAYRECTFKGLLRTGETKPCAIMMIYHRTDITTGANWYICIPSSDASELWQQTLDFINENFKDNNALLQTIIFALMKFSSQEVAK